MAQIISLEEGGKITLPDNLRIQYRMTTTTQIRLIETSCGILLVPITDDPISPELTAELEAWQIHAPEALEMFPYEGGE